MAIGFESNESSNWIAMEEGDFLECCGSIIFAKEMASASPFSSLQHALDVASEVWCNKVNIHTWLMAFNAHPIVCEVSPFSHALESRASSIVTDSTLKEIYALSMQYMKRFGFPYFTDGSHRDADFVLMDLKMSVKNKPGSELEWARRKQFSIIERHIAKYFQARGFIRSTTEPPQVQAAAKDFDLNKEPYWIDDLDPVAREKARRLCNILYLGEYYV